MLARSRGQLDPNAVAAAAIVEPDPTPPPAPEDGFHAPNHYRPSPTWKAKLDGWLDNPPPGAWQRDIHLYWRKVVRENQTPQEAWADLRMAINNARTALDRNSLDRGAIPPELFSRVLARSRAVGINADDDATDVIIDT